MVQKNEILGFKMIGPIYLLFKNKIIRASKFFTKSDNEAGKMEV